MVVLAGEICWLPLGPTLPIVGCMLMFVASDTFQLMVVPWPAVTVSGLAEKSVTVGRSPCAAGEVVGVVGSGVVAG